MGSFFILKLCGSGSLLMKFSITQFDLLLSIKACTGDQTVLHIQWTSVLRSAEQYDQASTVAYRKTLF